MGAPKRPSRQEVIASNGARHALRDATREDLDALLDIARSAHHAPWPRAIFAQELGVEFSQTWVIERAHSHQPPLLGSLVFWRVHDELHILDVAVHASAQGHGLGKGLIGALIAYGKDTEMSLITLEVRRHNEPAKRLYHSSGFVLVGERAGYYADNGEDALIMTRILALS